MTSPAQRTLLLLAACLGLALSAAGQTLQLKGGRILLAKVTDANADGLHVERLDNGGHLDLRWDHLTPECARRIQEDYGLIQDDEGEVMVEADAVTYTSGGARLELIGRIVERQGSDLVIETLGRRVTVAKNKLAGVGVRKVQVPVGQIFTDDQYYVMLLAEHAPGEDPDKHVQLADALMRARDYVRAEEHFKKAQELGGGRNGSKLASLIERVQVYQRAVAERDILDEIRLRRMRGSVESFRAGEALIAEFEQKYGDSPLRPEFERERKRFEAAQERFLVSRITTVWRRLIRPSVNAWLLDNPDANLATAKQFAESELGDAIAEKVAEQLDLEPDAVRPLFAKRAELDRGLKTELFLYGLGSLVLGEDGVKRDTKQGEREQNDPRTVSEDRELERLARKIREARDRARQAGMAGNGQGPAADTPEGWWQSAGRSERTAFLRAYYAEFGGDLEYIKGYVKPCYSCGAAGTIVSLSPEGKRVRMKCDLCHGTRFTRSVVAR